MAERNKQDGIMLHECRQALQIITLSVDNMRNVVLNDVCREQGKYIARKLIRIEGQVDRLYAILLQNLEKD